jgi:hypothetical protein
MSEENTPVTFEDPTLGVWTPERLEQARLEMQRVEAGLKAAADAKIPDDVKKAEFDKAVSSRIGGREFVRRTCGFDPGWPE